jgi:ATP-dependent helicase/nuclease subunit A
MRATPTFLKLNAAQRHALDTQRNLAVRAGAGSGKTSVLVERTVQLLARSWDEHNPLPLTAIVAVTFTRKAATELQERLRESFRETAAAATESKEQLYWAERIEELPRAMIGTIDRLCGRILRESALFALPEHRLEPGFEMLEGFEEETLKQEAIDRVIDRLMALKPQSEIEARDAEACRWWVSTHGFGTLGGHLHALLGSSVEPANIASAHQRLPPVADRVRSLIECLPGLRFLRQHRKRLGKHVQELLEVIGAEKKTGKTLEGMRVNLEAIAKAVRLGEAGDLEVLQQLQGILLTKEGEARSLSRGLGSAGELLRSLQGEWAPRLDCVTIDDVGEAAAFEAADRLAVLLGAIHDEYLRLCRQANRFDFLTIARRTRDLLRHTPRARLELQKLWRYVMVDEFQDTNALQWEILSWLVGEGPDGPLDVNRLFVVGDPEQSIYRFRGAEVTVFQRVQKLIEATNRAHGFATGDTDYDSWLKETGATGQGSSAEQRLGLMPLQENYRSLPSNLLDVVDRVMKFTFDPESQGFDPKHNLFETEHQPLAPGLNLRARGTVRYLIPKQVTAESEEERGPSALQARVVVDELIAVHGQPRHKAKPGEADRLQWKDMAVLLPSRTEALVALEKELRQRRLPYNVHKGIGFWQRQEVRDVVSLAGFLADHGDELSLFAVLRGPLGQLLDTEILFLSQLGAGSLRRGLRRVREHRETLEHEPQPDRLAPLSSEHLAVLSEVWNGFAASRRERVARTATELDQWLKRVDRMAHADLLQSCLEDSGALAIYTAEVDGDLVLGNLTRLWEVIRNEEAARPLSLARLARKLRALVEDSLREEQASLSEDHDAVQVMTVHAAKGLQFPVVAVMRLEHQADRRSEARLFVRREDDPFLPEQVEKLPDVPAGTISVSIRHPDRPRELFEPRVLQALRELDHAQQLAERRRLFYVAGTRAEERLFLAAKEPPRNKDGQRRKPREGWQRWFEDCLALTEEQLQRGCWENGATGQRIDIVTGTSNGDPVDTRPEPIPETKFDLEYLRELPASAILPVTGPAGLEAMRESWRCDRENWWRRYRAQILPHVSSPVSALQAESPESLGAVIGTIIHRLCQHGSELLQPGERWQHLVRAMASSLLGERQADMPSGGSAGDVTINTVTSAVEAICRRLCANDRSAHSIRALLTAPGRAEVPFILDLAGWLVTGRFDKLLEHEGRLEIVDWKTDADESVSLIVDRHRNQMALYALALHGSGRVQKPGDGIRVHLALLHHLHVESLEFSVAEMRRLERTLCHDLCAMRAALEPPSPASGP